MSAGPATPAVALRGLRKSFGAVEAVAGVDLEIADGEFFSMLGPSGSGKTTVLRMIAGFESPTAGAMFRALPPMPAPRPRQSALTPMRAAAERGDCQTRGQPVAEADARARERQRGGSGASDAREDRYAGLEAEHGTVPLEIVARLHTNAYRRIGACISRRAADAEGEGCKVVPIL